MKEADRQSILKKLERDDEIILPEHISQAGGDAVAYIVAKYNLGADRKTLTILADLVNECGQRIHTAMIAEQRKQEKQEKTT